MVYCYPRMLVFIRVARIPFRLLLTELVVSSFFSLWASFAWPVLYISLAAIPLVYTTTHNFSLATSNAFFTATCAGALAFTPLAIHQDRLARRLSRSPPRPESRIYCARAASALPPAGLFLFGWTARPSAHWIWPAVHLAVFSYLSDTCGRFAISAPAA
ncbi:MFS transporter [Neofusicoccum parvum]|nr:MFS transporter [Neofusicoccum parvum]